MILSSAAVFVWVGAIGSIATAPLARAVIALAPLLAAGAALVAASVPLLTRRDRVVSCVAPSARALSATPGGGGA